MLNFDDEFEVDANADVTCEQGIHFWDNFVLLILLWFTMLKTQMIQHD